MTKLTIEEENELINLKKFMKEYAKVASKGRRVAGDAVEGGPATYICTDDDGENLLIRIDNAKFRFSRESAKALAESILWVLSPTD